VLAKTIRTAGASCLQVSSSESWLLQLISKSVKGSCMLSMWLNWPARLKIRSCSRTRYAMLCRSRTSEKLTWIRSRTGSTLASFPP
jgi:hypothetical protein